MKRLILVTIGLWALLSPQVHAEGPYYHSEVYNRVYLVGTHADLDKYRAAIQFDDMFQYQMDLEACPQGEGLAEKLATYPFDSTLEECVEFRGFRGMFPLPFVVGVEEDCIDMTRYQSYLGAQDLPYDVDPALGSQTLAAVSLPPSSALVTFDELPPACRMGANKMACGGILGIEHMLCQYYGYVECCGDPIPCSEIYEWGQEYACQTYGECCPA